MEYLGTELKKHRKKKQWSQSVAARFFNISTSACSMIENGHLTITLNQLKKIAAILNIHPIALIDPQTTIKNENAIQEMKKRLAELDKKILSLQLELINAYERIQPGSDYSDTKTTTAFKTSGWQFRNMT